jgi:hypothetical protein
MASNLVVTNDTANDGWDDAAAEASGRAIQGIVLRFNDWKWRQGKEDKSLPEGRHLVAVKTAAAWVRWENKRPVEYIMREKGKSFPEREDLSMWEDRSDWEVGLSGDLEDPWRNTRYVYLIDPTTMTAYTFSTSAAGGRNAVRDLGDNIARVRRMRNNPNLVPLVELSAEVMPTKFGKKSKPLFKVIEWGGGAAAPEEAPQIDHDPFVDAVGAHPMDDSIPF